MEKCAVMVDDRAGDQNLIARPGGKSMLWPKANLPTGLQVPSSQLFCARSVRNRKVVRAAAAAVAVLLCALVPSALL